MVASYLLEAGQPNHNLDDLAQRYLHHETIKISELIGTGKDQRRMDEVPVGRVADYAGRGRLVAAAAAADPGPEARRRGLERLARARWNCR